MNIIFQNLFNKITSNNNILFDFNGKKEENERKYQNLLRRRKYQSKLFKVHQQGRKLIHFQGKEGEAREFRLSFIF